MKWKDGTLARVEVLSKAGKTCRLSYKDKTIILETVKGRRYSFDQGLNRIK
jgi:alpha-L-fucosidase 2